MVISLELPTKVGGGEAGERGAGGGRRKMGGRRMNSRMRKKEDILYVVKRSMLVLLTHGCVARTLRPGSVCMWKCHVAEIASFLFYLMLTNVEAHTRASGTRSKTNMKIQLIFKIKQFMK